MTSTPSPSRRTPGCGRRSRELRRALAGRFGAHHALMLRMHLHHVDQLSAAIERLDVEVDRVIRPLREQLQRLITIPGVGRRTAEVIIAEVGVDMRRFATAGHLACWAGMCPGNHESAGKRRSGRARKTNQALRAALCEAAWSATRCKSGYPPAQYRHLLHTFGKKGQTTAVFAVGHSILVIAWHLPADNCDYQDLGEDHFTRHHDPEARKRYLVRQLEALGHTQRCVAARRSESPTDPASSRVTNPCHQNVPGHRSFVSAPVPLEGRAFRLENSGWSPADAGCL